MVQLCPGIVAERIRQPTGRYLTSSGVARYTPRSTAHGPGWS